MFKFFIQRTFFISVFVIAVLGFVGFFFFAVYKERQSYDPKNFESPFSAKDGRAVVTPEDANNLAIQNLSAHEIGEQLPQVMAEILTFNKSNYLEIKQYAENYFTKEAYAQYLQFLKDSGFDDAFAAQNLQAGAFTDQKPVELGHGVYDGVYKWFFEVPVVVSFSRFGEKPEASAPPANRDYLFRIQMARVHEEGYSGLVLIELFQALPPRKTK